MDFPPISRRPFIRAPTGVHEPFMPPSASQVGEGDLWDVLAASLLLTDLFAIALVLQFSTVVRDVRIRWASPGFRASLGLIWGFMRLAVVRAFFRDRPYATIALLQFLPSALLLASALVLNRGPLRGWRGNARGLLNIRHILVADLVPQWVLKPLFPLRSDRAGQSLQSFCVVYEALRPYGVRPRHVNAAFLKAHVDDVLAHCRSSAAEDCTLLFGPCRRTRLTLFLRHDGLLATLDALPLRLHTVVSCAGAVDAVDPAAPARPDAKRLMDGPAAQFVPVEIVGTLPRGGTRWWFQYAAPSALRFPALRLCTPQQKALLDALNEFNTTECGVEPRPGGAARRDEGGALLSRLGPLRTRLAFENAALRHRTLYNSPAALSPAASAVSRAEHLYHGLAALPATAGTASGGPCISPVELP